MDGPVGLVMCDAAWTITWANAAATAMLDPNLRPVLAKSFATWCKITEGAQGPTELRELHRADRTTVWVHVSVSRAGNGYLVHLMAADHIAKKLSALTYQESTWRIAAEAAEIGVWDYNAKNEARFHSAAWKRMRGLPINKPHTETFEEWLERLHPDDRESTIEHVRNHNSGEVSNFSFEYRERTTAGNYVWILARGRAVEWDAIGVPTRLLGTDIDISAIKEEERLRAYETQTLHQKHVIELEKEHQQTEAARQIAHVLSRHDPLTQLPNRRVFSEEINRLLAANNAGEAFAVLLIDLDHFKPVNDLYGHATGDVIIRTASERLLAVVGTSGTIARLGGDEFGVIIKTDADNLEAVARECAREVIAQLSTPFATDGFNVEIGASVGVAIYPLHGHDAKTIFRNADMALYDVKTGNRGRVKFYSAELGAEAEEKALIENATRDAVANDEIVPFFQPIYDLKSGEVSALEVLARWTHSELGSVPPDKFVPIIEQFSLMPQFTVSMLRQTCAAALAWPDHISFSVNLTAKEVCDFATPIRLLDVLSEFGISGRRFKIEVTEQALMQDLFVAKQVIAAFRQAGVQVMLDDFGAGYAGLGYLRELKFDSIKIDRSFVMTLLRQEESAKIVKVMQTLAGSLNLKTVAEGIEDQQSLEAVRAIGCDYGQGFHFSRAVPALDIAVLLGVAKSRVLKSA